MLDTSNLLAFMLTSLALILLPGPAVMYIITRSIDQGRLAGIVSALGIALGTLTQVIATALGISAILVASTLAFSVVKVLGAAYLVYLGIRTLLQRREAHAELKVEKQELSLIFKQGVIVNVLNPKTALFFFAFLPQFVSPARGPVSLQVLLLGLIFVVIAICSDFIYAVLAGTLGTWLRHSRHFARVQKGLSGSVYILLGITALVSGSDAS